MKIYVGCAIQGLPQSEWDDLKLKILRLKERLALMRYEVLDFRSDMNRKAEPGSVFKWDYEQCMQCDSMIAIALHPSTGMGMEIMACLNNHAFVFATAPRGNNTSRMVTECNLAGYTYQEFIVWEEIPMLFQKAWTTWNSHP